MHERRGVAELHMPALPVQVARRKLVGAASAREGRRRVASRMRLGPRVNATARARAESSCSPPASPLFKHVGIALEAAASLSSRPCVVDVMNSATRSGRCRSVSIGLVTMRSAGHPSGNQPETPSASACLGSSFAGPLRGGFTAPLRRQRRAGRRRRSDALGCLAVPDHRRCIESVQAL